MGSPDGLGGVGPPQSNIVGYSFKPYTYLRGLSPKASSLDCSDSESSELESEEEEDESLSDSQ